jgi:RNA polymerase subunit RPABC4/transcription elongation factor Spt4
MDFKSVLIVDTVTGTVVNLSNCFVLQETDLNNEEWDEFAIMSDSEISDISKERGQSLMSILNSCNQIK